MAPFLVFPFVETLPQVLQLYFIFALSEAQAHKKRVFIRPLRHLWLTTMVGLPERVLKFTLIETIEMVF